jgi:hypothetical protein
MSPDNEGLGAVCRGQFANAFLEGNLTWTLALSDGRMLMHPSA